MCFQKTWFFRDFLTLDGSRIYSTLREDLDGPLHKRKKKSEKKKFSGWERGGVPLRGPPPFPALQQTAERNFLKLSG